MAFYNHAAFIEFSQVNESRQQIQVDVIYSGMVYGYVPTWERFPDLHEDIRERERDDKALAICIEIENMRLYWVKKKAANV